MEVGELVNQWPSCRKWACVRWQPLFGNAPFVQATNASSSWSVIIEYWAVTPGPYSDILILIVLRLTPNTELLVDKKKKWRWYSSCFCQKSRRGCPLLPKSTTCGELLTCSCHMCTSWSIRFLSRPHQSWQSLKGPCLYYCRFEPSRLGCLSSSVGRELD